MSCLMRGEHLLAVLVLAVNWQCLHQPVKLCVSTRWHKIAHLYLQPCTWLYTGQHDAPSLPTQAWNFGN